MASNTESRNALTATVLKDLNSCFKPHPAQIQVGNDLFYKGKERVFLQCGRKFGKSEFCIYSLMRRALMFPGTANYYFAPYLNQAKEIVWASRRLHNFLSEELRNKYGMTFSEQEMRIRMRNGSFIKVDGTDNFFSRAGVNPHFAVIDEIKDVDPRFFDVFEPNLAAHQAQLMMVGTPPDTLESLYVKLAEECKRDDKYSWYKFSTHSNPHIDRAWLDREKARLIARGEEDRWQREYMAEIVIGGSKSIFPMLSRNMIYPHAQLLNEIKRSYKMWDYYAAYDPGTSSCFAVLFIAVHRYSKVIYVMDEIYVKVLAESSTRKIYPQAMSKMNDIITIELWNECYDSAATWFMNEVANEYDRGLMPSIKDLKVKENKLSLIKDLMLAGLLKISDRCVKFYWEMENYRLDASGKIPKENDHTIDCFRYALNHAGYHTVEGSRPHVPTERREQLIYLEREEEEIDRMPDPFKHITDEFYD